MRVFREPDTGDWEKTIATAALGALGGLAIGAVLSRSFASGRAAIKRPRMGAAERDTPAPLRRPAADQQELDRLETAVLSEFLMDPMLRKRSIDIGAISPGIIELSGSVLSDLEARRAVALANSVEGVDTVVNRLDLEESRAGSTRRPSSNRETFAHPEGRVGGMGRRRQGASTDPDRKDDSQPMRETALAAADREQFDDEGFSGMTYEAVARPTIPEDTHFREDEMDNQDPHGKHARLTLDQPSQELNSLSRVGERPKPGTTLRLEKSDISIQDDPPRDYDR